MSTPVEIIPAPVVEKTPEMIEITLKKQHTEVDLVPPPLVDPKLAVYVDSVYHQLETYLEGGKPSFDNVMGLLLNLMQVVEKYPKLSGADRKTLILYVLEKYMAEKMGDDKDMFTDLIKSVLPTAVDLFVSLDKNKIKIEAKKCWKKWSCCS